ncbi:MAG: lasso RiPP family leader peptide-containing protein [Rhodothermales bacterium]|nr:lasso RiPP family leader peptide-containing protein [Rhodothermales bacterium]
MPEEKELYKPPVLKRHGDVVELTKSEYGGLDRMIFGSLFAISSPGLPPGPSR